MAGSGLLLRAVRPALDGLLLGLGLFGLALLRLAPAAHAAQSQTEEKPFFELDVVLGANYLRSDATPLNRGASQDARQSVPLTPTMTP